MSIRKIPIDSVIIEDYKNMSSMGMAEKYAVTKNTVCRHLK